MCPTPAFLPSAPLPSLSGARRAPRRRAGPTCAADAPAVPAASSPHIDAMDGVSGIAFANAVAGEWFGYEASFAVSDGAPMSVPEHYVPDEFRNWGVKLLGFEEVTSSRVVDAAENKTAGGSGAASHLYVKRTRALPSVGCEADAVVPESRVERFTAGADLDVAVSEYGVKGTVIGGAALGFDDGSWSAGPATFDQDKFGRWYACMVDPTSETPRRARLEFSAVNETRGAVVAFVETNDGPFCDGEVLPGCGGEHSSFAERDALTTGELAGTWRVVTTVFACEEAKSDGDGQHAVALWEETECEEEVTRSEEDVAGQVNVLMPMGLSVGMQKCDDDGMFIRAGWLTSPTTRVVVTRYYNFDGELVSISRGVETKYE